MSPATATTSANLPLAVACQSRRVALAGAARARMRMQESFGNPIYTLVVYFRATIPRGRPAGRVYICPRAAAAAGMHDARD